MTIIVLLAAVLLGLGAWLLVNGARNPRHDRIARRLATVIGRLDAESSTEPATLRWLGHLPVPLAGVQRRLLLASIDLGVRNLTLFGIAIVTVAVGCYLIADAAIAAASLAGILLCAAFYLNARAVRNQRRFLEQLPAFVERVQQLLVAGNSLVTAFEKALGDSDVMLRLFLSPVVVRMVHGGTLAESLNVQAIRLGIPQLSMLSVIAHANMRFGGTLSEILTHVVASLNNRLQVQHEFDAMTAEMRASAKVLAALPVVVIALVFVLNPGYLVFFADDPLGQALIGAAFAFAVLGGFILRALTRIED